MDPAQAQPDNDTIYIAVAFEEHCEDLHGADFEVCDNPRCRAAMSLESIGFGVPSLSAASFE